MKMIDRDNFVEEMFKEAKGLLLVKGHDYSGEADTNANFKVTANMTGQTKYEVWAVFFMKHILAIMTSIKDNPNNPQPKSEPIRERIVDAINYLAILGTLLEEEK